MSIPNVIGFGGYLYRPIAQWFMAFGEQVYFDDDTVVDTMKKYKVSTLLVPPYSTREIYYSYYTH